MANEVILEAQGLTKEFKGFVAVKNVSLSVRRHTIHALIGPNGAGKTTCFNLLTHFLAPTAGRIQFNGHEITGRSPAAIARMSRKASRNADSTSVPSSDATAPLACRRRIAPSRMSASESI